MRPAESCKERACVRGTLQEVCKGVNATLCKFVAGEQANGEARTSNIQAMRVTLDVSKPSGWLNARAFCAERGRKQGKVPRSASSTNAGRRAVVAAGDRSACTACRERSARLQIGGQSRTSAQRTCCPCP